MASTLRVAFIGTGGISRRHLDSITKFDDTDVVGLCDVNPETLKARQETYGGETFTDPDAMLDAVAADAVYICLPPQAHGPAERACIKRGIPFMIEKPVTKDLELGRQIAEEIKGAGLLTSVAYQRRYSAAIQATREILKDHPVTLAFGGWLGGTPKGHPWLTQKALSGGQMVEQTTHIFDLLRFLLGDAETVFCSGAKGFIETDDLYDTDDATSAVIKMKSGAIANIMSTWSSMGLGVSLTLAGPTVTVKITNDIEVKIKGKDAPEDLPAQGELMELEDRAFVDAVKASDPSLILCDYAEGLKSIQLSLAANESLDTGVAVTVG